jgi:hypothetical protein
MLMQSIRSTSLAALAALSICAGTLSAATARIASIETVHIDKLTVLRVTANGPIVWREGSGLSTGALLPSPLILTLYGVMLPGPATKTAQEMTTELGKLQLEPETPDKIVLTLTAVDGRSYRVRSGMRPNVLEIVSE